MVDKLKVLSLFSGIGAIEQAIEDLGIGIELIGFSEIDKFAVKSYCEVHNVGLDKYLGDITKIDIESLPKEVDLITHGSPCQDFSVAGLGRGADIGTGTRSSLMWNTVSMVEHCKPKYVLWENVKNVLSKNHKHNFDKYLDEMEVLGYDNYFEVLNAKDFGVPQNRERVFVISIRKDLGKTFEFPIGYDSGIRLKDILEEVVEEKYYVNTDKAEKLIEQYKGKLLNNDVVMPCITPDIVNKSQNGRRFKEDGEPMFTLTSQDRHGVLCASRIGGLFDTEKSKHQAGSVWDTEGLAPTLDTMQGGYRQPCITTVEEVAPNELDMAFTLKGTGKPWDNRNDSSGRVYNPNGIAPTVTTCQGGGLEPKIVTPIYRIRKLTPKECWRLMNFSDEKFDKAQKVNSNSQLYKQAGNSIVVSVAREILKKLL